jgi:hypothetical protein
VQIAASPSHNRRDRYLRRLQSVDERVVIHIIRRKNRGDVNSVSPLAFRQHQDDAFESPFSRRRQDMKYADTAGQLSHRTSELNGVF